MAITFVDISRLAATLGPRSRRITRKQLTAIDLTRTCELIAEPPEPMALRLSGCLLVGVARCVAGCGPRCMLVTLAIRTKYLIRLQGIQPELRFVL